MRAEEVMAIMMSDRTRGVEWDGVWECTDTINHTLSSDSLTCCIYRQSERNSAAVFFSTASAASTAGAEFLYHAEQYPATDRVNLQIRLPACDYGEGKQVYSHLL